MAILEGSITLNELTIAEVDSDPSISPGLDLPMGSIASLGDDISAALWLKTGPSPTDWSLIPFLPSFTTGSIPFGDSGNLTQDNNNFFWDNTNKRLGLGYNTPVSKIHIDSGTSTASNIKFTAGSTTGQTITDGFDLGISNTGIGEIRQRENLGISFFTNNIERMAIEAGGRTRVFNEMRHASLTQDITNTTTSTGTLTLPSDSTTVRVFTGTATGQIVRLPDATTLLVGRQFDIWNLSSETITIQDNSGNLLTDLRSNGRTICMLRNNSSAAGTWGLTYTLDNGNVFGTNVIYVADETETSNTSNTTWATKITLNTPSDTPLGIYLLSFQFIWRSSNADREADFRYRLNTSTTLVTWSPSTGRTADRQLLSGFVRITSFSGSNTIDFQFKRNSSASATIFVQQARMFLWRIG